MSGLNSPRKSTRANKGRKSVRFEEETFTPGSNNQYTTGRKIDSGAWIPNGEFDSEMHKYENDTGDVMFANLSDFVAGKTSDNPDDGRKHWTKKELTNYYKAMTEMEGDTDFTHEGLTSRTKSHVLYDYATDLPAQEPYTSEFKSPSERYEEMMKGLLNVNVKWIRTEYRKGQSVQIFEVWGDLINLNKNLQELAEKYNWYILTTGEAAQSGLILDYPDEATVENWIDDTRSVTEKIIEAVV